MLCVHQIIQNRYIYAMLAPLDVFFSCAENGTLALTLKCHWAARFPCLGEVGSGSLTRSVAVGEQGMLDYFTIDTRPLFTNCNYNG